MATDDKKAALEEITRRLEDGIKDIFSSRKYRQYLSTMSKFHNYSLNNTVLIAMQKPDATYIAGYQSWKKNFGRHVKKGEKGIQILAPSPYKITVNQEKKDASGNTLIGDNGKPLTEKTDTTKKSILGKLAANKAVIEQDEKQKNVVQPSRQERRYR